MIIYINIFIYLSVLNQYLEIFHQTHTYIRYSRDTLFQMHLIAYIMNTGLKYMNPIQYIIIIKYGSNYVCYTYVQSMDELSMHYRQQNVICKK